ncbi:MAG: polysaccharide deacetylase family protein [Lachnospiraceae bacterium]|nr:polysaccharide deacetylase family protein [Lachnospiraceae bacterium]
MHTEKRLWLIACAIFVAAAAFTIFAGFSIAGMTSRGSVTPSDREDQEEDPFETGDAEEQVPVETLTPEGESEEEPQSTEPETLPDPVAGNIHLLTTDDLEKIGELYSGDPESFHSGGEKDESNRSVYLTALSEDFSSRFKNVQIFNGDTEKTVSFIFILTAENGRNTEFVLNHLLSHGVKATFFMDYYYAAHSQGLIRRMLDEGHELGSLGYSLPEGGIASKPLSEQQEDAMQMQQAFKDLFEYDASRYYFGYEAYSDQSLALMTQMGYKVNFFTANYADYNASQEIDTAAFLEEMKAELCPGAVYCLHTVNNATVDMLPQLLDYITENGYTVTLLK